MLLLLLRLLEIGRRQALLMFGGAVVSVVAGAAAFAATQHVPYTTGLYWAVTTATTVGYGDVTPHNAAGRLVATLVMLTSIPLLAAVFALLTGSAAAAGVQKVLAMAHRFPEPGFRLIIGMHPAVPAIVDELAEAGEQVVLVADVDPVTVHHDAHVIKADPTRPAALRAARPAEAGHALVTGDRDGDVLVSAVLLRKQAPRLPVSALVRSTAVREALRELGIRQAICADALIAHTLAKSLESPHASDAVEQLVDSNEHTITELDVDAAAIGKPLSVVRGAHADLVLGLVHDGAFTLGVGEDPLVVAGDRLLVVTGGRPRRS